MSTSGSSPTPDREAAGSPSPPAGDIYQANDHLSSVQDSNHHVFDSHEVLSPVATRPTSTHHNSSILLRMSRSEPSPTSDRAAAGCPSPPAGDISQANAAGWPGDHLPSGQASNRQGKSSPLPAWSTSARHENSTLPRTSVSPPKSISKSDDVASARQSPPAGHNSPAAAVVQRSGDRLSSVRAANRYMFDLQDSCDVKFVVKGPGDVKKMQLGAHRYVLCSRSPVFYRMLWNARAGGKKKIKENDIPAESLREVIRFLYCEEAHLTPSNVFFVLRGAHKYHVPQLSIYCLRLISRSITDDYVCALLDNCVLLEEEELVQSCLRHVERNASAVLQTPGFLKISVETLTRIVSCDALNVPELHLFNACVAWARGRLRSQGLETPSGSDLRRVLNPVIPWIRFPTMTESDFAKYVVPLNILDSSETCNIYVYLTCPIKPQLHFMTTRRGPCQPPTLNPESSGPLYPDLGVMGLQEEPSATGLIPSAPELLSGSLPPKM